MGTRAAHSVEVRFEAALDEADRFFMKEGKLHRAVEALARRCDAEGIAYAVAGAMAMGAHGYERMTSDVDVLVTRAGLERFKRAYLGRGYVEKFPGSKGLRDTENGVAIDVLIAGEFPGDGLPKSVQFPDPDLAAVVGTRFRILNLPKLVELKLASGMTAPHRLKDLADVLELIRTVKLAKEFAADLDPFVRDKYLELWGAAQVEEAE